MTGRFTVLASGSSGNAALLETKGFGLLIDCGLHPRILLGRLREAGATWNSIHAVIITHTHGDHWKDLTLAELHSKRIPVYAHPDQLEQLSCASSAFESLRKSRLTRKYEDDRVLEFSPGLQVRPIRVSHDAEPTFAFRIDASDESGLAWSVGYASDLGCGSPELVEAFAGVDVLALEYNHDVKLERRSRRPRFLIDRVLGDCGHLSNDQAGELTTAIAARSGEGFPAHLVQLHLSRECNKPPLAAEAGRAAIVPLNPRAEVITARQDVAAKSVALARHANSASRFTRRTGAIRVFSRRPQPLLPGFES